MPKLPGKSLLGELLEMLVQQRRFNTVYVMAVCILSSNLEITFQRLSTELKPHILHVPR